MTKVSIIMGSTSDLPVMRKAADFLEQMEVPFEMHALSAHRTPGAVENFAKGARDRGIQVIIAAAGMAAALPGVIAAMTTVPVINGAMNAAVLAVRMLALSDADLAARYDTYCAGLCAKVEKADAELAAISDYKYKTN